MTTAAEHNAQISQKMLDLAPCSEGEAATVRVNRAYFRINPKNLASIAARIKTAHRTFPRGAHLRAGGGGRVYPTLYLGMTTAEYVIKFQAHNNFGGAHVLPIDFDALGDRPAALYENGAIDFDVLEDVNEEYFVERSEPEEAPAEPINAAAPPSPTETTAHAGHAYSIDPARYSKPGMLTIHTPSPDGYRTRASRLASTFGKWSHRQNGYVVTASGARRFAALYAAGWDASYLIEGAKGRQAPQDQSELRRECVLNECAAHGVASLLASAQAAAAIDQASESAALHQVADVVDATTDTTDTEAGRELATVDAEACEAVTRCELASAGGSMGAPGHGSATAARPAAGVSSGQQINSKSGNWSARFYTAPDGRHVMAFSESGGAGGAWPFESGRERMAALQTMARNADQAAQDERAAQQAGVCPTVPNTAPVNPEPASSGQFKTILQGVSGSAPDQDGQNPAGASSGQFKSKIDPVLTQEQTHKIPSPASAFERVKPFNMDPLALLASGIDAAQLVGLGVTYTGNMANPDGVGAITSVADTRGERVGALRLVVTLEDGRLIHAVPHYFTAELRPILQFNSKMHGAPYLAQLAGAAATVKASTSATKAQAEAAHAKALIDLPAQYPQLKRAETSNAGGKLAAVNMRILLKAAFAGVKFGVTSDYSSVRVSWTDGPSSAEVDAVIGRFDIGASDSQSDYFYTIRTAFSELFGGCQYLSTSRTNSPAQVAAALAARYPDASARPSVEDYTQGRGAFDWGNYANDGARRAVREQLESMGVAKPADSSTKAKL